MTAVRSQDITQFLNLRKESIKKLNTSFFLLYSCCVRVVVVFVVGHCS